MSTASAHAIIVGGGAFGLSAALSLRARHFEVTLVDPGPIPHPSAASTDISKIIRADYGRDALYTDLCEIALQGWREVNDRERALGRRELFHETGFVVLTAEPMRPGGFEHDSFAALSARGYPLERLDAAALARRFSAWRSERFADGYYNPIGGWAESARVVALLAERARAAGVELREGSCAVELSERGGAVVGVRGGGETIEGDAVVVCAGAWTQKLVPELGDRLASVGQPVLIFRPANYRPFCAPSFVPWAADIGRSGWYGFCANAEGLVKVANHGPGTPLDPDAPRSLPAGAEAEFRGFLQGALPPLAAAPIVERRLCLYCDAFDGDFLIARHPERRGLCVAAGGSGHAFKFAPALGDIIADAVEGKPNRFGERFRWRQRGAARAEQARAVAERERS